MTNPNPTQPDTNTIGLGLLLGLITGSLVTLLTFPKKRDTRQSITTLAQQARDRIEDVVTTDPVAESLATGKATARRRRDMLGLPPADND